jgi:hypothetical protein
VSYPRALSDSALAGIYGAIAGSVDLHNHLNVQTNYGTFKCIRYYLDIQVCAIRHETWKGSRSINLTLAHPLTHRLRAADPRAAAPPH